MIRGFSPKDASDNADFTLDWTAPLNGDTIASITSTSIAPTTTSPLTVSIPTAIAGATTVTWLSGGLAGTDYVMTVRVVTTGGRTLERSAVVPVSVL